MTRTDSAVGDKDTRQLGMLMLTLAVSPHATSELRLRWYAGVERSSG